MRKRDRYLKKPFKDFFKLESAGSIILLLATIAALVLSNSGWGDYYADIWNRVLTVGFKDFKLSKALILWINDGLMAIFFFVIGLEIKREILIGELNTLRKSMLPISAALGGMVIPVGLFLLLNQGTYGGEGWGIPMATDIAFSLGILKILGNRVPLALKVLLTAYAIIDDIGAVLVIALFYSGNVSLLLSLIGIGIIAGLAFLSYRGYYSKYLFFLAAIVVWVLFLKAGIHPTVAGILMGLTIPARRKLNTIMYVEKIRDSLGSFRGIQERQLLLNSDQMGAVDNIETLTSKVQSPLQRLENNLHGWVIYFIIPLFAFANAGVDLSGGSLGSENGWLAVQIAVSMVGGKVIGISLFSWIAIKLGFASLPGRVNMTQIIGVSFLGGLGFTMALFIANLAYTDPGMIQIAKLGILAGSVFAGALGYLILRKAILKLPPDPDGDDEDE